jgi:hypothetical protein
MPSPLAEKPEAPLEPKGPNWKSADDDGELHTLRALCDSAWKLAPAMGIWAVRKGYASAQTGVNPAEKLDLVMIGSPFF